jgi:hypothetical protein
MFVRTALAILLGAALAQIPDAGERLSRHCDASISPDPLLVANVRGAETVSDMVDAGRAQAEQKPSARDPIIRRIAIYASLENYDGLSISVAQLREQGVRAETIRAAAIWEKIHEPAAVASSHERTVERPGLGWDASH